MTPPPHLRDRIGLVTGATSGIGYETALGLAKAGARVGIVGRDAGKVDACADALRATVRGAAIDGFVADLSSQAEIRRLAAEVGATYPRLDVLVNNAGAIFDRRQTSADGFERTWALDHLGYVLLTLELLDLLRASGRPGTASRIVNVASAAHTRGRIAFDDLQSERAYGALRAYAQAKLGNVLFTYALARRLAGVPVTVNALHPGVDRHRVREEHRRCLRGRLESDPAVPEQTRGRRRHLAARRRRAGGGGRQRPLLRQAPRARVVVLQPRRGGPGADLGDQPEPGRPRTLVARQGGRKPGRRPVPAVIRTRPPQPAARGRRPRPSAPAPR